MTTKTKDAHSPRAAKEGEKLRTVICGDTVSFETTTETAEPVALSSGTAIRLFNLPEIVENYGIPRVRTDAVFYLEEIHGCPFERTLHFLQNGTPFDLNKFTAGIVIEVLAVPPVNEEHLLWENILPIKHSSKFCIAL